MAEYPAAIKTFREISDLPGVIYDADQETTVFAKDTSDLFEEVVAIEETLGTNPAGNFATVGDALAARGAGRSFVTINDGTGYDLPDDSTTTLIFADNYEDSGGVYDPITGIFTCLRDGRYSVDITLSLDAGLTTGSLQVLILVNGTAVRVFETKSLLGYDTWQVSATLIASAEDEIMIAAYQNSGVGIELGYYNLYNVIEIREL